MIKYIVFFSSAIKIFSCYCIFMINYDSYNFNHYPMFMLDFLKVYSALPLTANIIIVVACLILFEKNWLCV